jgi:hypothetical protein
MTQNTIYYMKHANYIDMKNENYIKVLEEKLEENNFSPISHKARRKADNEEVQKQRVIVAKSISDCLDIETIPYLRNDHIISSIHKSGWNIFRPAEGEKYIPNHRTRANRYYAMSALPSDVKIIRGDSALLQALQIPERLAEATALSITHQQSLKHFLYKNKEEFFSAMKEDYQEIYSKYGGYEDLLGRSVP